jgi:hypothetical protein
MTKSQLIETIEGMYPADSPDEDTAKQGRELLSRAIIDSGYDWRSLPVKVLEVYLDLCTENQLPFFNLTSIDDE